MQGTKLECSQQCRGCARFSRKAVTRRLTAALLPAAVCLLAFFGFVGLLYFLPACLIIITRQHTHTHTHTPLKKKAGAHPQNLPKKRETTPLKTDVFLPLFSADRHTDTQKIKGHWTQLLCIKKIQVSNNGEATTKRPAAARRPIQMKMYVYVLLLSVPVLLLLYLMYLVCTAAVCIYCIPKYSALFGE